MKPKPNNAIPANLPVPQPASKVTLDEAPLNQAAPSIDEATSSLNPDNIADFISPIPVSALEMLRKTGEEVGGAYEIPADELDAIGRTMFDSPQSQDNSIVVLMPSEYISKLPSQALVRIRSKGDNRTYAGIVTAGPFAEPDGLRADAPIVVTTTVRGIFLPRFHGRVHVEVMHEILADGTTVPPRYRPLPNSPVYGMSEAETAATLKLTGDVRLGVAIGHDNLEVNLSAQSKAVLPRHTAILGTTGGGKSTTVSGMIKRFQEAGLATILFDTEGEYTDIDQVTTSQTMLAALKDRGLPVEGAKNVQVLHLVGRETTATETGGKAIHSFGLRFDDLSPYMLMEILDLNEAQQARFLIAYDLCRRLLRDFSIFPRPQHKDADQQMLYNLDDMERGHPELTLVRLYDAVVALAHFAGDGGAQLSYSDKVRDHAFKENADKLYKNAKEAKPSNVASWRVVQGKLGRLMRLKMFDTPEGVIQIETLTCPGTISIIDLSDTESPELNNIVIATMLRSLQATQEEAYTMAVAEGRTPPRVVVIIEEAHEFLAANRIRQMPALFQQIARIAKRGRKRWLGLIFVTQLPQHLPSEVLGLTNNYILHKIGDANVISELKRSIGRIDDGLWNRVQGLAPGQAVVAIEGMSRPLIVSIDPSPCKLRLAE